MTDEGRTVREVLEQVPLDVLIGSVLAAVKEQELIPAAEIREPHQPDCSGDWWPRIDVLGTGVALQCRCGGQVLIWNEALGVPKPHIRTPVPTPESSVSPATESPRVEIAHT